MISPLVTAVENALLNQCGPLVLGFELAKNGLPKDLVFEISKFVPEYAASAPKNAMFMTGFAYVEDFSYEAEEAKRSCIKARLY